VLDWMRDAIDAEAAFDGSGHDGSEHHVADVRAGDAGTRHGGVGDGLGVGGVDDAGHP
jgi:hypothetical protein